MREILFRGKQMIAGKRVDNAEWVYGDVMFARGEDGAVKSAYMRYIEMPENADKNGGDRIVGTMQLSQVEPETVGQYTGVYANGVKIFEGDIVHCTWYDDTTFNGVVVFEDGKFLLESNGSYVDIDLYFKEVIGNIYDKGGEAE